MEGRRAGFVIKTLDGKRGYLAHEGIKSEFRIRNYGVSIENIEAIAAISIAPDGLSIIILDEIGKMECFSEVFRRAVISALNSRNIVLGTITVGGDDFIRSVKKRPDIEIVEVTPENRELLPDSIIEKISELGKSTREKDRDRMNGD